MTRRLLIALCASALCPLVSAGAAGAATTFTGATNSDWNTPTNWSDGIPDSADDVTVTGGKNPDLSSGDANGSARSISLPSNSQLTVGSGKTLNVSGGAASSLAGTLQIVGSLVLAGDVAWSNGIWYVAGSVTNQGTLTMTFSGDAPYAASNGGAIVNTGTWIRPDGAPGNGNMYGVAFHNNGVVNVGAATFRMEIFSSGSDSGDWVLQSSTSRLEMGGTRSLGSGASISGLGTLAALSGTLTIGNGADYTPAFTAFQGGAALAINGTGTVPRSTQRITTTGSNSRPGTGNLDVTGGAGLTSTIGGLSFVGTGITSWTSATADIDIAGDLSLAGGTRVELNGTADWTSGTFYVSGATLQNKGTLNMLVAGGSPYASSGDGGGIISNTGTWNRPNGTAGPGRIESNVPFVNAGNLVVGSATTMTPVNLIQSGGTTSIAATGELETTMALNAGDLTGAGTLDGSVTNAGGTVKPGSSPGILSLTGNYTQQAGGTLQTEINGTTPGTQFDRLAVGGTATLGGTLQVANGAGFDAALNTPFKVLTATTRNGSFANVTGTHPPGKLYVPRYDPSVADSAPGVTLVVQADPSADTTPPDTSVTGGPSGLTNDSTPTFSFTSTEAGSTFECKIDGDPNANTGWAACNSGSFTPSALAGGAHTFYVRARDTAGNTDQSPASRAFTVDTTPPDTSVTGGPTGATNDSTPTFSFTSTEVGSTFECKIDGDPNANTGWAACNSGSFTPSALTAGAHTFYVRATDQAGNTDQSPASRAFTVDTPDQPPPPPPPTSPPALRPGSCANARVGTRGADLLIGTIAGDLINGLGGNDRIDAGAGNDCLNGGAGSDTIEAGEGDDRANGNAGADRLTGGDGNDKLAGNNGNDRLSGGDGNDRLQGGAGKDGLSGGDGRNAYSAGGGNDSVNSVNGTRERVNCGGGRRDRVRADRADRLRGCETVTRAG